MLTNRFGGGVAGVLTGTAIAVAGVALLLVTRDIFPPPFVVALGVAVVLAGLLIVVASLWLPRALIWRRSPSGRGYVPLARYYRAPREADDTACWHCGARLRRHAKICAVCGATRPTTKHSLPPLVPAIRSWNSAGVVPAEPSGLPGDPGDSAFPLYTPDGWDRPVHTGPLPVAPPTEDDAWAGAGVEAPAPPPESARAVSDAAFHRAASEYTAGLPPLPPLPPLPGQE